MRLPQKSKARFLIADFWVATGALSVVSLPLFGGYWKLSNWSPQQYASDISTMEARIRSTRLVPKILELINELLREQRANPAKSMSEILSESTYADRIRAIAETDNEISEVKNTYKALKDASYALGNSLLYLGVLLLLVVPVLYFWGSSPIADELTTVSSVVLVYTGIVICAAGVIPSLAKRIRLQHNFSKKYDEIIIG